MNFGSLGSFEFLWQCLSSLEIFDRNAKASWSNFKVDRNPEFRSLKQGYKKRNSSNRDSLNWHYPSILYPLWMRRNSLTIKTSLKSSTFCEPNTKVPQRNKRNMWCVNCFLHLACFYGGMSGSYWFFRETIAYFQSSCFCTIWIVDIQSGHSTYTWDQTLCITWGILETLHCIWGSLRQFC